MTTARQMTGHGTIRIDRLDIDVKILDVRRGTGGRSTTTYLDNLEIEIEILDVRYASDTLVERARKTTDTR